MGQATTILLTLLLESRDCRTSYLTVLQNLPGSEVTLCSYSDFVSYEHAGGGAMKHRPWKPDLDSEAKSLGAFLQESYRENGYRRESESASPNKAVSTFKEDSEEARSIVPESRLSCQWKTLANLSTVRAKRNDILSNEKTPKEVPPSKFAIRMAMMQT
ncbi:hypothetical protein EV361DRAFT_863900 [Lentinula raphanica]|nr:hypothetical protein EV361DRAFT_863900 [Lentinula raphanica]